MSPSGRALFSGYIDKTLPKDGKTIATGYAYLGSYKSRGPFFTDESISEFRDFTHFVARVRGDGKRYFVVLDTSENMHHTWFSRYKFMLYTHGGPYWQYVKVCAIGNLLLSTSVMQFRFRYPVSSSNTLVTYRMSNTSFSPLRFVQWEFSLPTTFPVILALKLTISAS